MSERCTGITERLDAALSSANPSLSCSITGAQCLRRYIVPELSSLTSNLKMAALLVWLVTTLSASAAADQPICSQLTQYTMYDPDNSDVPTSCRICPKCPPGEGVPVQCGAKVPYGTNTDCVPCEANKTYSDGYDSSHCKSCNMCEKKIVVQECTTKRNRKCGGCPTGYYLDPHLDTCKECFFCCDDVPESQRLQICKNLGMPRSQQCEVTHANKKCKMQASIVNRTTTTKPLTKRKSASATGSAGTTVSVGGITTANSTAKDPSKLQPIPTYTTHNKITKSGGEDHGVIGSNSSPKDKRILKGFIGGVVGLLIAIGIALIKRKQSKHRNEQSTKVHYNVVEQGEAFPAQNHLTLNTFVPINAHDRATPSSQTQNSTESSTTSSAENLHDGQNQKCQNKGLTQENISLYIQRIPEGNCFQTKPLPQEDTTMLTFIPEGKSLIDLSYEVEKLIKKLDHSTPRGLNNWRDVGQKFEVPDGDLDDLELEYKSGGSPVKGLTSLLHAKHGTTLRTFVKVLQELERKDIADGICLLYKKSKVLTIEIENNSTLGTSV